MKKAVLFDLDGVLLDSMHYHVKAWEIVFSPLNISVKPNDIYSREGTRTSDLARMLIRQYRVELSDQEIEDLIEKKSQTYNRIVEPCLMPGAMELIDELKQKNIYCAIVTSSFRENLQQIMPEDFLNKFDVIITARDVSVGKPDPQPYLKAAEKLNLFPGKCVVIENAAIGVKAALAAGMPCVAITSTQTAEQLREADLILNRLDEVKDKIQTVLMLGEK